MKPIETLIKVTINNIQIDDDYYSFDYKIEANGKVYEDEYCSDHVWRDDKSGFRSILKKGGAAKLALESINEIM